MPVILAALGLTEGEPAVVRLVSALGGEPSDVLERAVGEPVRWVRRLVFAGGGEIVLHDGVVVGVLLHLGSASGGGDLSAWVDGVGDDATLDDLQRGFGLLPRFVGFGQPYFELDGGYARFRFRDNRGWKEAGNLLGVVVTSGRPGVTLRPEDEDCPVCSGLLVREAGGGVDVEGTVGRLSSAVAAGEITEDAYWVKLADLLPLHASGLMQWVESQFTCGACRRIVCFTLYQDSSPTFGYYMLDGAQRRLLEAIPPVEQWADAARIAEEQDGMRYLDHEPGAWFLVAQQGVLYLDARYGYGMIDGSVLIRLDDGEVAGYRDGGHEFVSRLAARINDSAPIEKKSPYYARDLYRGPEGGKYRKAVSGAISNHTWRRAR